jgi:non-heme chloroperoxidase
MTTTAPDGTALAFDVVGEGPPDVLFLHGWAGSGAYFRDVLGELDLTRLRAVTIDLRGHGGSAGADGEWTLDQIAADTLAAADAVGATEFVVLGFSMGAKFAQYLALKAPERVRGLMLVAGCPASEIPLPPELLEDWYGREGDAARLAEIVTAYASNPIEADALERFGEAAAGIPRSALEGSLTACTANAFDVGSITAPTLVIGGLHDAIFGPDVLRGGVVAQLPNARLALVDAGHEIPLERPREFAALVEAFLAGLG